MQRTILVPLDGSEIAEAALPHAAAMARATNRSLLLVQAVFPIVPTTNFVWSDPVLLTPGPSDNESYILGEEYLLTIAEKLRAQGLTVQTELIDQEPAKAIVQQTERDPSIALIVMTTHGRSGLSRWLLGSVAERVLHHAPVPLLLVHANRVPTTDVEPQAYSTIMVALDGSRFAEQALERAQAVAKTSGGTLLLVAVVPDVTDDSIQVDIDVQTPGQQASDYLDEQVAALTDQGFKARSLIMHGDPAESIIQTSVSQNADLIVMATHGRSGFRRLWLGSVALRVVRSAERPVLLVRVAERARTVDEMEQQRATPL